MNTFLRAMFWTLTLLTCAAVIFSAYNLETPLAVHLPVETIAIWGSIIALICAVGLFFAMPSTRNGRIGLLVALVFVGFTVWTSFQTLQRTKFLYREVNLSVNIETSQDPGDGGETKVTTTEVGGTLYLPVNRYELPVALLMPDHTADSMARNQFYAKALARRGVAAVAYGRNPAPEVPALVPVNMEKRGEDVLYVMDLLEKITEIYMRRAGLIGFEENEWVVPFTMQKTNRLNFAILIAPTGMTPAESAIAEVELRLRSDGFSGEEVDQARQLLIDMNETMRTGDVGPKRADLITRWEAARGTKWFEVAGLPAEPPAMGSTEPIGAAFSFNPSELWPQVKAPVHLYTGTNDRKSLPETLRERFNAYYEKSENPQWELDAVAQANHLMLLNADRFGATSGSFPPGYFDALATWIKDTTRPADSTEGGAVPQ